MDRVSVPLWGTFLSEPLDIVGTVGRYPAVYLMSREPIRNHQSFQLETMQIPVLWGVRRRFHRLSPGYGHVAHALRTLAPVAARCIATPALPLDLHVLSLPLAFILSQDQTLLCIYTNISKLDPDSFQKKKSTLSFQNFSVLACTSFSLVNERVKKSHSTCERDCKGNQKI